MTRAHTDQRISDEISHSSPARRINHRCLVLERISRSTRCGLELNEIKLVTKSRVSSTKVPETFLTVLLQTLPLELLETLMMRTFSDDLRQQR